MPKELPEPEYVLKTELDRALADLEQYAAAMEQMTTDNAALKAKVAELEPHGPLVQELKGKLSSIENLRAFEKIADEMNLRPEAREDVWKLAEYKAEGDQPDATKIRDHINKFLESPERKKLYTADGGGKGKLPKGEGADRGGSREPNPRPQLTRAQASDPEYMMKHQDAFAKAASEGYMPQIVD